MTDETYNGWANYATWVVNLHLSNDHGLYLHSLELTADAYRSWSPPHTLEDFYAEEPERVDRARLYAPGEALESFVRDELIPAAIPEEHVGTPAALLAGDLIAALLADVDWPEIAEAFLPEGGEES